MGCARQRKEVDPGLQELSIFGQGEIAGKADYLTFLVDV
jgi:hypothetical protein